MFATTGRDRPSDAHGPSLKTIDIARRLAGRGLNVLVVARFAAGAQAPVTGRLPSDAGDDAYLKSLIEPMRTRHTRRRG